MGMSKAKKSHPAMEELLRGAIAVADRVAQRCVRWRGQGGLHTNQMKTTGRSPLFS